MLQADFLKLVKNTGIKLNVSHIPKGDTGIKVVNGVKVLDYDFVEGINQKDQNYSYDPNNNDIGNVIVGINDEQIRIAMIDDFIDYIIPFHTNKAKNINDKLGTGKWWNYKNYQVDKNQKTGRKRNINIYTEVLDIYRPKNKTEFVNAFLKVCQNKNMIPRYEQFLNREYTKNGAYIDEKGRYNYVYTEGYHKFLVDFKLFDKSGNIALQREIVPSLDKEYMKSLLEKEVERRKKYEFDQETFEKVKAQFEQAPSLEELKTDGLKKSKNKYDLDFSAPMLEDGVVEEEGDSERDIIEATERISEDYNNGKISREEYRAGLAKLYEEAVKTYGQFPQGEKAVEDIAVPKKVSKSKPVMRFIRTLVESGAFTEDMLEDMSAETLLGNFSYTAVSDESAQEKAEKVLASGKADTEWEEAVIRGQIGKDDIALGEMLLMDAINRNDRFEVLKLSSELADMFTRAGRIVQAARMFKKMTGVGKVVYVNRMVDTLNKSLKEKYGDKFGEGKAIQPIKVDPRLLEELGQEDHMDDSDLYEKNPESVITDIKRNIAEQIPSTWLDKLNAWRYFAMLSNLRTHVRNFIGNVISALAVGLKNVVGTVAERTLIRDTNQRTKAVFIAKEYRDFAQKDIKTQETKMMLKGEGQLDEKTQIQQMRRTFETEWLEKLVKGNSNLLEAEDMIFKSIHYKSALASYLQAKKVDLKNIDQKTLDQAREYAVNEAKKATFQDASLVADMINKMFKIPKGSRWEKDDGAKTISTIGQFAVEGILPFKRTPINIVKRGVEYSPIGLTKTLTLGLYNVYKKKITMSEFCDGLASGITGTGIALVGMLTYSLGWISAGFGDDDEDKFKKLNGEQEYAVQVFGKSYSMDWAAPACLPFFIGVELMQEIDKDRNLTIGEM